MKKIITIVLSFFAIPLFAQEADNFKGFKLGLAAHPTFGYIKSDISGVNSNGIRLGFSYGLLGDFAFAQNYAFSTGLKLTTINGQTETAQSNNSVLETYKLQYIEIPLKVKLMTTEASAMRFYGEFGLGNGINVRAKQDTKAAAGLSADGIDIYDNIAIYRASLIIGGGAEFKVGEKTRVMTGLSFDNGFTDIKKGTGTLKNSYIGLNLGVFF